MGQPPKPTANLRVLTVRVLLRVVVHGDSLKNALPLVLHPQMSVQQQAVVKALSYGVLRWYIRLEALSQQLLQHPVKPRDRDVLFIILIGLYQLCEQSAPNYALVSESVNAVGEVGKVWAKKLVNAVLRGFLRRRDNLLEQLDLENTSKYSYPEWLIQRLQYDWPDQWQGLLLAGNKQGPMVLRVNTRLVERTEYINRLSAVDIVAEAVSVSKSAIQLAKPCQVSDLPGFDHGLVSVQDAAAQFAAPLLNPQPGDRVLDACTAPGGKLLHIIEQQPELEELVAVDIESGRGRFIDENLQRVGELKYPVVIKFADVALLKDWWDGRLFQRILLDVPCSASGVIRRHPDIKILRRKTDIHQLAKIQALLLDSLWQTLEPGGLLLYSTCSVFKEENQYQIEAFIQRTEDAQHVDLPIDGKWKQTFGYQLMTGAADMDGFFYAGLLKNKL